MYRCAVLRGPRSSSSVPFLTRQKGTNSAQQECIAITTFLRPLTAEKIKHEKM